MKKKHPEHVNLERWLVSYADFITLLFAFFVVMYAISQADLAKVQAVSQSMRAAFGQAGPVGFIDQGGQGGGMTASPFESADTQTGRILDLPVGKTHTASDPDPELQSLKELLEETMSLETGVSELSDQIQLEYDSTGLIVRLAVKDLFDQGKVEIAPELRPLLDRIGRVLAGTKRLIRIEGHTDLREANPAEYPSDWELSTARAAWVARYWTNRFSFDPKRLGVAGYGHHRPLTLDTDKWARASNRRIEIIILNNQYR